VRERLRARYTHVLLDEFQDTDPIQWRHRRVLATGSVDVAGLTWNELPVDPGRLFLVGDPKQSIYRFPPRRHRRVPPRPVSLRRPPSPPDPELPILPPGDRVRELHLRSADRGSRRLPTRLRRLEAARVDEPSGPGVVLLGITPHDDAPSATTLREREAADVVAAIRTAVAEGWEVTRRDPSRPEPCRLSDICVLLPARTSLGQLQDALDAAGIPYRAETSSLVYGTREIRDLLNLLRAVDDPTDELALVSALRSSLLGAATTTSTRFKVVHRGHWNHQAPLPESLPPGHPVATPCDVSPRGTSSAGG